MQKQSDRSLVRNAADPKQVKKAKKEELIGRDQELDDIRSVCKSKAGRRLLWRLMEHCKPFESIWSPSAAIHHNAGKQDVGHFIMREIIEADENIFFQMMKESQAEKRDQQNSN